MAGRAASACEARRILLTLGDSSLAHREFLEAKRLKPDDWFLRNEIVGAYTSRGRYELAVEELREATGRAGA